MNDPDLAVLHVEALRGAKRAACVHEDAPLRREAAAIALAIGGRLGPGDLRLAQHPSNMAEVTMARSVSRRDFARLFAVGGSAAFYEKDKIGPAGRGGQDGGGLPASLHFYNAPEEVDRLVSAVGRYLKAGV